MGNQQERSLAWCAGILEAEGSISVQVYTLPDGRVRLTPYICLVNSDRAILEETKRIWDDLARPVKKALSRWCGHGGTNKPCWTLRLDGPGCGPVLDALLPYMIGDKRKNANVVLEYLASRKDRLILRDKTGRLQRVGYTRAEIELVCSIRTHKTAKSSEAICRAPNIVG